VFASRLLHEHYPYAAVDRTKGFGIEDWSWHMETLWAGILHYTVPDIVHMIRMKEGQSLNHQNASEGHLPMLPHVPSSSEWWR
jgi:hypothetical protein